MERIEINGTVYHKIVKPNKTHPKISPEVAALMMIYGGGLLGTSKRIRSNEPEIDIVSEFKLIQHKKSNLSRRQREWVVSQFNSMYTSPSPKD